MNGKFVSFYSNTPNQTSYFQKPSNYVKKLKDMNSFARHYVNTVAGVLEGDDKAMLLFPEALRGQPLTQDPHPAEEADSVFSAAGFLWNCTMFTL